ERAQPLSGLRRDDGIPSAQRRAGAARLRGALRRSGGALVARYHPHLSDHALLPVGRTCGSLVSATRPAQAADYFAGAVVAACSSMVRESPDRGFTPARARRDGWHFREYWA